MSVIVDATEFNATLKLGLAKVKSAIVLISASKTLLTLAFYGPAIRYRRWIPCRLEKGDKGFSERGVSSDILQKLIASYKGDMVVDTSSTHVIFKCKGTVTIPSVDVPSDFNPYEVKDVANNGAYKGVIKNHPLYHTSTLKKSLQAIKDNIAKEELIVEAKWGGKSKTLDVMVIDQFHGVLCRVDIEEMGKLKEFNIKLPLSAFLLLIDSRGDITIDGSRLEVRGEDFEMSFTFLLGASYASIDDMLNLVNVKPALKVEGLLALTAAKKATAISQDDDHLILYTKNDVLFLKCETEVATIKEAIPCAGKLPKMKLTPKNFLDLLSSMGNSQLSFSVSQQNLVVRTHSKNPIFGAMTMMEN